ncbi:glycine N-acyltransferase-like protein 3 isoform X3 [Pezoporus flaviventris]|uniref:glycine N-acyltransferase-like protein 3 isoform X3 n=1 Tax=Pezoporus flaviventris TaxID=889875 RepID=UPI002AAFE642|nr:glycine N-acyltransferase-like protein 3 isoform X3 [Pezoporus flaviventris]
MLILTCPAQLQRLEGALRRSLPLTLPVYGAVMNINRGNPAGLEVVVDAWPEFGAVLARRRGEVPVDDCYRNTSAVFYRDLGAYRALLETPGCLRWDAAFYIIGLQDGPGSGGAGGLPDPGTRGSAQQDVALRRHRSEPAVPGGAAAALPQPLPAGRGRAAAVLDADGSLWSRDARIHAPRAPPQRVHVDGAGPGRSQGSGSWLPHLWVHGHREPAHAAAGGGAGSPAPAGAVLLHPAQPRPEASLNHPLLP